MSVAPVPTGAPGTLGVSICRRNGVVELSLSGDLDLATAPRLGRAVAWLRSRGDPTVTIVINTTDVDFVAAAGYHALRAVLVRPDGLRDPRVVLVVGPALTRLERAIAAAEANPGSYGLRPTGPVAFADRHR